MKNTILSRLILLVLVFACSQAFSQRKILSALPSNTSHYAIFNNPSQFEYINFIISKVNSDSSIETVFKSQIWNQDYFYIPQYYFDIINGNFMITIQGIDSNNAIISEETAPILPEVGNVYLQWICNSYNYAYELTESDNGPLRTYWLEEANDEYVWWDQAFPFEQISLPGYPMLTNFSTFAGQPGAMLNVPNHFDSEDHYNIFGAIIEKTPTSLVRGLPKKLLPQWEQFQGQVGAPSTNPMIGCNGNFASSPDENLAASCVGIMVSFFNSLEPDLNLECFPIEETEFIDHEDDFDEFEDPIWNDFIDKGGVFIHDNNANGDNGSDIWDFVGELVSKIDGNDDSFGSSLTRIHSFRLEKINSDEKYTFSHEDFVQANINPSLLNFTLSSGMYRLSFALLEGKVHTQYFALEDKLVNNVEMKDFISPLVYANPITEDNFNLSIHSDITTTIYYEMLNSQGLCIHKDIITIKADTDSNQKIIIPQGVPNGIHVHKFTLPDGSWKTTLTIK